MIKGTSRKTKIWDLVKSREEERELLKRALNVGLCPECGGNVNRKVLNLGDEHDDFLEVKYTCKCGFIHLREE